MTLRVLHLVGSSESSALDDLSQLYARGCLEATADAERYHPMIAHVSPDGAWRFPAALTRRALADAGAWHVADAIQRICELDIDVMIPHMFDRAGMTRYRALFDLIGVPWVGNSPEAMAITARKDVARALVAAAGVAVPFASVLSPDDVVSVDLPVVVKPVDGDNSDGVTLVRRGEDLAEAVRVACSESDAALAEQFIAPGREIRCGVLEREGELIPLPLEEYPVNVQHPIRMRADKLAREDGELQLVAKGADRAWIVDAADPIVPVVWEAALACHRALGCRHYSLFDFRIDAAGRLWFLEAGLYCSFSPQSVVATMARAAGIPLGELFAQCISAARDGVRAEVNP